MSNNKTSSGTEHQASEAAEKKEGKNGPVTEALKKEEQPNRTDDLSSIHDTHEVGTAGGDQRAPDKKVTATNNKKTNTLSNDVEPASVEEPGKESVPGDINYDEPNKKPVIKTRH